MPKKDNDTSEKPLDKQSKKRNDKPQRSKPKGNKSKTKPESEPEPKEEAKITAGSLTPIIVMAIFFIISIGFAIILAPIYVNMGLQADFSEFGGEESLWIPVFYVVVILVFTAVILFVTRKRKGRFIKYAFLGVICLSMTYVFYAVFGMYG